jgi:hypothetical protein
LPGSGRMNAARGSNANVGAIGRIVCSAIAGWRRMRSKS